MKRISLLLITVLMLSVAVSAQAYESSIQYDKKKQQALAIDYTYSPEAVQNAFISKLERMGYKAKEEKGLLNRDKGFLVYKSIFINDISSERLDYMVKVERKSRKASDEAVLYIIVMKGDQNALPLMDSYTVTSAKNFLNNLVPDIEAADLELQIQAQQEVVAKAEKKLRDLKDDQANLERKLAQNKTDQDNTQKDIENQKQQLGVLTGKRKSN